MFCKTSISTLLTPLYEEKKNQNKNKFQPTEINCCQTSTIIPQTIYMEEIPIHFFKNKHF